MSKAARRLGRGLDSLVSNLRQGIGSEGKPAPLSPPGSEQEAAGVPAGDAPPAPSQLPMDAIRPNPFQPRSDVTETDLDALTRSIRRTGLLQPIVVRPSGRGYEIIAGERRWHAAKKADMTTIPVVIRDATDEQMLELALVENLQREDLNAIDRGAAYRQFCTRFNLKPEEVADRVGEDRTTVVNYMRLLELSEPVRRMVAEGRLSMGHARCLLGVRDDARRERLAESAAHNELSVRALEEIVRRAKTRGDQSSTEAAGGRVERSAHLKDLEVKFEQAVKTKVTIHEGRRKGTGRITIEYYGLDDFDRIAALLGVAME